jgi:hypothetical protein
VTDPTDPTDPADPTDPGPRPAPVVEPRAPRSNRVALLVIFVGFLLVLAAIIGGLAIGRSAEPIGDAFATVQGACRAAHDDLRALGRIGDIDAAELSARVDLETGRLREMLVEFDAARTGNADGQRALEAWTADWEQLLDARDVASRRIAVGEDPDPWLPPIDVGGAEGIDGRIDEYARRERLTACTTDILEADNLDGQRTYRDIEE